MSDNLPPAPNNANPVTEIAGKPVLVPVVNQDLGILADNIGDLKEELAALRKRLEAQTPKIEVV